VSATKSTSSSSGASAGLVVSTCSWEYRASFQASLP
jgi:hypothetical protein